MKIQRKVLKHRKQNFNLGELSILREGFLDILNLNILTESLKNSKGFKAFKLFLYIMDFEAIPRDAWKTYRLSILPLI